MPADSSTIQKAINGANAKDTVLVAIGIYSGATNGEVFPINMKSGVVLKSVSGSSNTWIMASSSAAVISCVDADSTTVIRGFKINQGYATNGGGIYCENSSPLITENEIFGNQAVTYGAGIYCEGGAPKIYKNNIHQNTITTWNSITYGAGIGCIGSSCQITENHINDNYIKVGHYYPQGYGGAIYCKYCTGQIENNIFENNSIWGGYFACIYASGYGAAVCCEQCTSLAITGNTFHNNTFSMPKSTGYGGAIYTQGCYFPRIIRNTIKGNGWTSTPAGEGVYGGGMFVNADTKPVIRHNVIASNIANWGGGLYIQNSFSDSLDNNTIDSSYASGICSDNSSLRIFNNIICNSPDGNGISSINNSNLEISYNDVWQNAVYNFSGCAAGTGDTSWGVNYNGTHCDKFYNIISDPLFSLLPDSAYHLQESSPCINAGNPTSPKDPDSTISDMGAFYFHKPSDVADDNEPFLISDFELHQNYPNPFNPVTQIEYTLNKGSKVELTIFNIIGQKVAVLVDEYQTDGHKKVWWDGRDDKGQTLASGIYFYYLKVGDITQSKKMTLLK